MRMMDVVDDEDSYGIIMELMSGRSLADLLKEKSPFPEEEVH